MTMRMETTSLVTSKHLPRLVVCFVPNVGYKCLSPLCLSLGAFAGTVTSVSDTPGCMAHFDRKEYYYNKHTTGHVRTNEFRICATARNFKAPTAKTPLAPSSAPSVAPTLAPSTPPTTGQPTKHPTAQPTRTPTAAPTTTAQSTLAPTKSPSASPHYLAMLAMFKSRTNSGQTGVRCVNA